MAQYLLQIAKIVGTPTAKTGSWVHTFSPNEREKIFRRGQLLAVVCIKNPPEAVGLADVGKEIISRLHEEYYGELGESPFEHLKKAVSAVFTEAAAEMTPELAAVSLVQEVLNVSLLGGGKLVVLREGKLATILTAEKAVTAAPQVTTASGYVFDEDLFILGTEEFFQQVSWGVLQAALGSGTPEGAAEALMPVVHSQSDGQIAAAIIFKVKTFVAEGPVSTVVPEEIASNRVSIRMPKIKEKIVNLATPFVEKFRRASRPQKTLLTVFLTLVAILVVSLVFGLKQRVMPRENQNFAVVLTQAQEKLKEAQDLASLNPTKAQESLAQAQSLSQQLTAANFSSEAFANFQKELEAALGLFGKERSVTASKFFDLGMLKAQAQGDQAAFLVDQLIVLDKNQTSVYGLDIKEKKSTILAGGDTLKGAKSMAVTEGKVAILTDEGIKVKDLKSKSLDLRIKKDSDWGEIAGMGIFGNNLYLLDIPNGIWKYPATETGFGAKQTWLKAKPDLSSSVSLAIDGSIWIVKTDGSVLKFTQGSQASFQISGLAKPISQATAFYTDENSENLYLLDSGNSRIVVLKKTGEYLASYLCPEANNASGLAVSEADKKIWLLMGSKIYEIGI